MKKRILLSLFVCVAFIACEKTNDIFDKQQKVEERADEKTDKEVCFELVYPVMYVMPDGSSVSANDEKEIHTAIKSWYEAHPDVQQKPFLQYPVDVLFWGKILSISNEVEMIKVKKACSKDDLQEKLCFEIVYPITYLLPDGNSVIGNDEEEINAGIKCWYNANPDSQEKPSLQYPVSILFKGKTFSISNEDEMIKMKEACAKDDFQEKPCFEIVYPITYLMPDGNSVTGNDEKEVNSAIKSWYEAHPDSEEKPALQYPVDVVYKEKTLMINNAEEMVKLKESCK